ncbi:YheC/YheD family endospore coat-associated protein [Chengkuizengella axinellae]|uniref:YheC/YheD family protein n=1 Tax=Chengkuizengella axinellae TaxID=3064388 RepID=A0ABT9IYX7_9BACL|nr:YheC/YheD family protein [Chengkuizengella sp. 2205SS18-9]MDP5274570.1 YheC/YheD family protein [Chengkuizengella sp. 2205SS18-9]
MYSKYIIYIDPDQKRDGVYMNQTTLRNMKLKNNWLDFHYGQFYSKLMIKINDVLKDGIISIPQQISDQIIIPDLPYEYQYSQNKLRLGPIIGCMILKKYYKNPHSQIQRFSNYNKIKGLIFLFTYSQMDHKNSVISGYYYNPKTNSFVKGFFPYPDVIFNRSHISLNKYNILKEEIGNRVFNYPYKTGSKLKFWNEMRSDKNLQKHLPVTQSYTGIVSVIKMLDKYSAIYMKPTDLYGGKGIIYMKKEEGRFILITGENIRAETSSHKKLKSIIDKQKIENNAYILQQAIEFNSENCKVDFRAYLQKNGFGRWNLTGLEARIAKRDSIITNYHGREKVEGGDEALLKRFKITSEKVSLKKNEILKIGRAFLNKMETDHPNYHLGDVAIDLVVDVNLNIWVLEVQINYGAERKLSGDKDDRRVIPQIFPTPFTYAKSLAGFHDK